LPIIHKSYAQVVLWSFNDYFMLTDPVHLAKKPSFFLAG